MNPLKSSHVLREPPKWVIWNSREDVDERQGFVIILIESIRCFFRSWKWGYFLSIRSPNGFLRKLTGKRKELCSIFLSIHQLMLVDCFPFLHLMRTYKESNVLFSLLLKICLSWTVFCPYCSLSSDRNGPNRGRQSSDLFKFTGVSVLV